MKVRILKKIVLEKNTDIDTLVPNRSIILTVTLCRC